MKKGLIALSLVVVTLALPLSILAIGETVPAPETGKTIDSLITSVKGVAWKVFALIALICFIIAGITFLTAAGDPEKIATARNAFIWGIVGVVAGILAFSIITFVQSII